MHSSGRRALLRLTLAAAVCAAAAATAAPAVGALVPAGRDFTATWTRAEALKVRLDPTNTKPRDPGRLPGDERRGVGVGHLAADRPRTSSRSATRAGTSSSRSSPRATSASTPATRWRDDRLLLLARRQELEYGGDVFPRDTARGARQWAGSAVLVGDRGQHVLHGLGRQRGSARPRSELGPERQSAARARAAHRSGPTPDGVWFAGQNSATAASSRRPTAALPDRLDAVASRRARTLMAFRDPFVFRDPADDQIYMLFEGNIGGQIRHGYADVRTARDRPRPARPRRAAGRAPLRGRGRARARRRPRTCAAGSSCRRCSRRCV